MYEYKYLALTNDIMSPQFTPSVHLPITPDALHVHVCAHFLLQLNVPVRVGYVISDTANAIEASEEFEHSYATAANQQYLQQIDTATSGPQPGYLSYWISAQDDVTNPARDCDTWLRMRTVTADDITASGAHLICPPSYGHVTQFWDIAEEFSVESDLQVH